jgi:hypothetical protein
MFADTKLVLVFPRPQTESFRKAIEDSFQPNGGLIAQGAIFYVDPAPSLEQIEYVVHNQDRGVKGKLKLVGMKEETMEVFDPVVSSVEVREMNQTYRVHVQAG